MALSHEHVESKIPAKINTNMLTRAELLITLCYEIPCISKQIEIPIASWLFPLMNYPGNIHIQCT